MFRARKLCFSLDGPQTARGPGQRLRTFLAPAHPNRPTREAWSPSPGHRTNQIGVHDRPLNPVWHMNSSQIDHTRAEASVSHPAFLQCWQITSVEPASSSEQPSHLEWGWDCPGDLPGWPAPTAVIDALAAPHALPGLQHCLLRQLDSASLRPLLHLMAGLQEAARRQQGRRRARGRDPTTDATPLIPLPKPHTPQSSRTMTSS